MERKAFFEGDTCGRQCEGTAYRIEAANQKRRADALEEELRIARIGWSALDGGSEFNDRLARIAKLKPDQWTLKAVAGENFLIVPEWFVVDAVKLANSILRPN